MNVNPFKTILFFFIEVSKTRFLLLFWASVTYLNKIRITSQRKNKFFRILNKIVRLFSPSQKRVTHQHALYRLIYCIPGLYETPIYNTTIGWSSSSDFFFNGKALISLALYYWLSVQPQSSRTAIILTVVQCHYQSSYHAKKRLLIVKRQG